MSLHVDMTAEVSGYVSVCVLLASPVVVEAPQNVGVDVLRNVSLPCQATGKPRPTVTWTRSDGTPLQGLMNASNTQTSGSATAERFTVHTDGSLNIHRMSTTIHLSVIIVICFKT